MLASRLMLDPDLVREVLRASLANGGRFAELFVEERTSLSTRLDDGKVEELTSGLDRGAGIRVVHGETAAYAYSNRLDRDSLVAVAEAARASVTEGAPTAVVDFRRVEPPLSHRAERPATSVTPEAKVAWLREA